MLSLPRPLFATKAPRHKSLYLDPHLNLSSYQLNFTPQSLIPNLQSLYQLINSVSPALDYLGRLDKTDKGYKEDKGKNPSPSFSSSSSILYPLYSLSTLYPLSPKTPSPSSCPPRLFSGYQRCRTGGGRRGGRSAGGGSLRSRGIAPGASRSPSPSPGGP